MEDIQATKKGEGLYWLQLKEPRHLSLLAPTKWQNWGKNPDLI